MGTANDRIETREGSRLRRAVRMRICSALLALVGCTDDAASGAGPSLGHDGGLGDDAGVPLVPDAGEDSGGGSPSSARSLSTELVAGSVSCASPNYHATVTLSHEAAAPPVASSPRYRLVSGVVATQQ